jgi:hypothetical protein
MVHSQLKSYARSVEADLELEAADREAHVADKLETDLHAPNRSIRHH